MKRGTGSVEEYPEEHRTFDLIVSIIGDLGPYQLRLVILIFISKFSTGFHSLSHIFLAAPQEVICIKGNTSDPCSDECKEHQIDTSVFNSTIISEWDLICKKRKLAQMSQSIVMIGIMLGAIFFGMWADRSGRRPAFLFSCILQLIAGLLTCIVPNFILYCIARFLVALATGAMMATSFVLLMEIIGPKYREIITNLYHIPFNLGHALLALFGYYIRSWRWFQFAISVPSVIFIVYIWLIPESPRWFFSTGRLTEAIVILETAAKGNNMETKHIRSQVKQEFEELSSQAPLHKASIMDLFKFPYLRFKTLVMCYCWIAACMTYYGVAQFITTLKGDVFIHVAIGASLAALGAIVSIPLTKFIGRRYSLMLSNFISAFSLGALAFPMFNLGETLQMICATIGLFGGSITFPVVYLYGAELFPTVARAAGMGLCSFTGRIGSICAPFIVDLEHTAGWLPPSIFGIVSVLAILCAYLLPETRGHLLPETLEEGDHFGKKHHHQTTTTGGPTTGQQL